MQWFWQKRRDQSKFPAQKPKGATLIPAGQLAGHASLIDQVAFVDDTLLMSSGEDVRGWNVVERQQVYRWTESETFALAPDKQTVALLPAFSRDGPEPSDVTLTVRDIRTEEILRSYTVQGKRPDSMVFSPDGRRIAMCGRKSLDLLDAFSGENITSFPASDAYEVISAIFLSDECVIAQDRTQAQVWDISARRVLCTIPTGDIDTSVVLREGQLLAVCFGWAGRNEWTVEIYDVRTGNTVCQPDSCNILSLVVSPDGKTLVGVGDGINIWDTERFKYIGGAPPENIRHNDYTRSAAFSPNGGLLATGSPGYGQEAEPNIRLWRVE